MLRSLSRGSGSAESVGASPHSRSYSATTSPSGPTTVTSKAPIATATSREAIPGPAEQRRSPPALKEPCLSHLRVSHVTHAKGAPGSGESAARSDSNGSPSGVPLR